MSNKTFDRMRSLQSMFIPYVIGAIAAVLGLIGVMEGTVAIVTGILTVANGIFGKYLDLMREDYNAKAGEDHAD